MAGSGPMAGLTAKASGRTSAPSGRAPGASRCPCRRSCPARARPSAAPCSPTAAPAPGGPALPPPGLRISLRGGFGHGCPRWRPRPWTGCGRGRAGSPTGPGLSRSRGHVEVHLDLVRLEAIRPEIPPDLGVGVLLYRHAARRGRPRRRSSQHRPLYGQNVWPVAWVSAAVSMSSRGTYQRGAKPDSYRAKRPGAVGDDPVPRAGRPGGGWSGGCRCGGSCRRRARRSARLPL